MPGMPKTSPAVDRYIENAPPFAQPILTRIRKAFHKGCPDLEETMKWSVPFFDYKGPLGNMAAFKQHVRWGFWKASMMSDPHGLFEMMGDKSSMGGGKVSDVAELPADKVLVEYVREAVRLNEEGVKTAARPKKAAGPVEVPEDLAAALKKNAKARAAFEKFPPGQQREYAMWLTEAKQEVTRQKRLATAIEWIAEGKSRNWKYEKPK
jgi:uncharacterized protein YdeI (YjbR/CyaY-like superfamily)